MEKAELDSDLSYVYGWFLADGNLYSSTRNRGKLITEISYKDKDILEKMSSVISSLGFTSSIRTRTRNTNFKENYKSACLSIFSLECRNFFKSIGFPEGSKSGIVKPPKIKYDEKSFARGYIDADGSYSIGKKHDIPVISICLSSDDMYFFFCNKIEEHCGYRPNLARNKRDNVYNLQITRKNALIFINWLDYKNSEEICLERKKTKALELINFYKDKYK